MEDLSQAAYERMVARLRLNFAVALATTSVAVVILTGAVSLSALFAANGKAVPAALFAGLAVVDVAYGIAEKPWRNLWTANNRVALAEAIWIAFIESRDAALRIPAVDPQVTLSMLRQAHNLLIVRVGAIGLEDYGTAFETLSEMGDTAEDVQLKLLERAAELGLQAQLDALGPDCPAIESERAALRAG